MMGTTGVRARARQKRRTLGLMPDGLVAADEVLAALEAATGITRRPLPPDDARLGGAQAVLSVSRGAIFQDGSRSEAARHFDAAHEYAHVFLHMGDCRCAAEDLGGGDITEPAEVGADRVEDHSPRRRREAEANAYAAELLLPDPLLRRLFFEEGHTAEEIAGAVGLPTPPVLARMTEVLLLPPLPDGPAAAPTPAARAVELDASQAAAAEHPSGPLLLGAGPGTGKTKTLVGRCRHLVRSGVPAERILCLTFSRDAAQEMRERLAQAGVGSDDTGPWVGTFHAFGRDLLRRFGARAGLPPNARLIGTLDAVTLLENHLPRLGLDALDSLYDPAMHLKGILRQISRAKDELCPPARYAELCREMRARAERSAAELASRPGKVLKKDRDAVDRALLQAAMAEEIARCYAVYEELLAAHGYLDFGDLIARAVQTVEAHPDVAAMLRSDYPHVLADEYQDVNRACARLIRLLAGGDGAGLWAVGDHRQGIYRFRGASPANVAAFRTDYPTGERRELGVNYRSLRPVVDCFGAVARALTPDADRDGFRVWEASRGGGDGTGPPVTVATAPDEEGQADGIARAVRELYPTHPYAAQAVLCRTHAQARAMADLLTARDIPVLYLGDLMGRPEVKDLRCLLSLFSPEGPVGLLRVAAFPEYAVPPEAVLTLMGRVRDKGMTVGEALQDPTLYQDLGAESGRGLRRLAAHLAALAPLKNDPAALLRHYLFDLSGFLRPPAAARERPFLQTQRLMAVHQFHALALAFDRRIVVPATAGGPPGGVGEFLAHLRRQATAGESPQGAVPEGAEGLDAVRILTAHKAKGLEYPVVYVPNMGQGQFPARGRSDGLPEPPGLSDTQAEDAEEEQYLFFVALSRARDRLVLSRAAVSRTGREIAPSPLLSLLDGWLAANPSARAEWPSGRAAPAEGTPEGASAPDDTVPTFSASALETYERCPRQYYYEREIRMPGASLGAGYPKFHACVRQALNWVEDELAAGRSPDQAQVQDRLDALWAASGPIGHLHEAKYRAAALEMLCASQTLLAGREPLGRPRLTAALTGCRVTVRPDSLQRRSADGVLVVARRLMGRPGDDDHLDKRLALLRRAAAETFPGDAPVLELQYLSDGRPVPVPPPPTPHKAQQEADRLKKYERAAHGIRLRLFPAEPASADTCQTCAYALICPLLSSGQNQS